MNFNAIWYQKKSGYELIVDYESWPENPRNWDNIGKVYAPYTHCLEGSKEEIETAPVKLPVYMTDHSAISLNTSRNVDKWDTGLIGWTYATAEDIKSEYNVDTIDAGTAEKVKKTLESELQTLEDYLNGNVYQYAIIGLDGEKLECCGGYYGDVDCVIAEGKRALMRAIKGE